MSGAYSLVAEHELKDTGASAVVAHGIFPNTGIEPVSPALAGRFFSTEPPGEPWTTDSKTPDNDSLKSSYIF